MAAAPHASAADIAAALVAAAPIAATADRIRDRLETPTGRTEDSTGPRMGAYVREWKDLKFICRDVKMNIKDTAVNLVDI